MLFVCLLPSRPMPHCDTLATCVCRCTAAEFNGSFSIHPYNLDAFPVTPVVVSNAVQSSLFLQLAAVLLFILFY